MPTPHAGSFGAEALLDSNGALLKNTPIDVRDPTTNVLVAIYGDANRSTTISQPISTDAAGDFGFFAEPGRVRLVGPGVNRVVTVFVDPRDVPGPQGVQGVQGVPGPQGLTGQTGVAGPTGGAGPTGDTGPAGTPGSTGATGPGFTWQGPWNPIRPYVGTELAGYGKDVWLCVQANTGVMPGTDPSRWELFAKGGEQGDSGPTGATGASGSPGGPGVPGAQGPQGIQGTPGIQGIQGNTGATGPQGASFDWQGPWLNVTNYDGMDCVEHLGSLWVCIQSNTNIAPSQTGPAVAYWQLGAKAGNDGAPGATGPQGDSIDPQGAWVSGTYDFLDVVRYKGAGFIALRTTSQTPPDPAINSTPGPSGPTGPPGPPGPSGTQSLVWQNQAVTSGNPAPTASALNGHAIELLLQANMTGISVTNANDGDLIVVELIQDGTGARTVTWPAAFSFGTTGTPPVNPAPNARTTYPFIVRKPSTTATFLYLGAH